MAKRSITRIPEVKPIVIGRFTLTATGLEVTGRPSFEEYQGVGDFIKRAHQASGWWLADWLRYGDTRAEWQERIDAALGETGLSEKTLKNVRAIGSIDKSRRRESVEFGLHAEVAAMDPDDQTRWLDLAESEGWTRRELRLSIHAAARRAVINGQAVLEGMYRVIYSDNPWLYGDRPSSGVGQAEHYPPMTIEEQCKLPIAAHAMPNAVLLMWITAPVALQNPGPREVGEAWGFTYKQQIIWDKVDHNLGHYTGCQHEILTIWTRGSCLPDLATDLPDSVQVIRKSRQHSEKPEEFRRLIEKHWTSGPYLELFGRERHEGWTVFGNDARLWATQAEEQSDGERRERDEPRENRRALQPAHAGGG